MQFTSWMRMAGLVLLAAGCCKNTSEQTPQPVPDPPVGRIDSPIVNTVDTPVPPSPPPPTPAGTMTDPNRPGRGLDGLPAIIPPPNSTVPTIAEWDAAPWEITVSRSTPLGCETKMVREWLRVSCRDENTDGGKVLGLLIEQKGGV